MGNIMNIIKFDFNEMVTLQGNQVRTTSLIINLTYISPMFPVHTGINRQYRARGQYESNVPCTHRDFSFMQDFANFC